MSELNLKQIFVNMATIWNNFFWSEKVTSRRDRTLDHREVLGPPLYRLSSRESDHIGMNRDSETQPPGRYHRSPLYTLKQLFQNH